MLYRNVWKIIIIVIVILSVKIGKMLWTFQKPARTLQIEKS